MDYRLRLGDDQEAFRSAVDGRLSGVWTSMPGVVVSVDGTRRTCNVQPTVMPAVFDNNGRRTWARLPVVPDVPIVFPRGGGYFMSFPLGPGDEVLLVFASRRIDFWWQSGGVQPANDVRMHDLSDAFAIPGPFSQAAAPGSVPAQGVTIRNADASMRIDMGVEPGVIRVEATTKVHIKAPIIDLDGSVV